jgi:HEAT repeat protein
MMRILLAMTFSLGCAGPSANRRAAEEVVWRSLSSTDVGERREATRITAEVADPILDRGLAERLDDGDPVVRATAAAAMANDVELARGLLRSLLQSPVAEARVAALDGIRALSDGRELAEKATADADESVRARAAWMVRAAEPLEKLLSDPTPGVRAEALRALANLDASRAAQAAEKLLSDAALAVRLAALSALVKHGDRERLLALAGGDDRWVALRAAVQLKGHEAQTAVERAASDKHAALRVAAMNAAGELGDGGRALIRGHLGDADLEVRLAAARALLSSGGAEDAARKILRSALGTDRKLDAADELARLGDGEGRRALAEAARANDPLMRRAAIASLGALSPEPPELASALRDGDFRVRLTAARALLRRALRPYLR